MATQLIRLQLIDGDPDGLRVVSIAGRTTVLAAVPMAELERLLARPEADKVAVYFMIGSSIPALAQDADGGLADSFIPRPVCYVGQTGSVQKRFSNHHKMTDADWSALFVATTTCGVLNSAHAVHVESLLTSRAKQVGKFEPRNQTQTVHLDDGDKAFADDFAANVVVLAQILGADLFRGGSATSQPGASSTADSVQEFTNAMTANDITGEQIFEFYYSKKNPNKARMLVRGSRFVVLAGSQAIHRSHVKVANVAALREKAFAEGFLNAKVVNGYHVFDRDMEFTSPSAAGAIVYGSACAGPSAWWLPNMTPPASATPVSYGDWLAQKATQVLPAQSQTYAAQGAADSNG